MNRAELSEIRIAHGHLCTAFLTLRLAQEKFKQSNPEAAARIGNIVAPLDALIPSYTDFDNATSYRRRA